MKQYHEMTDAESNKLLAKQASMLNKTMPPDAHWALVCYSATSKDTDPHPNRVGWVHSKGMLLPDAVEAAARMMVARDGIERDPERYKD